MFKRIDHIELLTTAPERTIAFYVDVLGFRSASVRTFLRPTPDHWISSTSISAGPPSR